MSWHSITEHEIHRATSSYRYWAVCILFGLVITAPPALLISGFIRLSPESGTVTTDVYIQTLNGALAVLIPVLGIGVAYNAIAGERDSGTLKLLMALPYSRRDLILGKTVGRMFIAMIPVVLGFTTTVVLFGFTQVQIAFDTFLLFTLMSLLLTAVFTGLAVGVSASVQTGRRAALTGVGALTIFIGAWGQLTEAILQVFNETPFADVVGLRPKLHMTMSLLNPTNSYRAVVESSTLPETVEIAHNMTTSSAMATRLDLVTGDGIGGQMREQFYLQNLGGTLPVHLTDPFLVGFLIGWIGLFPIAGYLILQRRDL